MALSGDCRFSDQLRLASLVTFVEQKDLIKEDLFKRHQAALGDRITDDSFFEEDYFEQMARTAGIGIWAGIYQIMSLSRACNLSMNMIYPLENGEKDRTNSKLMGGFFPAKDPSVDSTDREISVITILQFYTYFLLIFHT